MIIREKYLKELRPFYNSDLIKIITGVRRSGKSFLMEQIKDEIKQNTDNFVYLDFEDKKIIITNDDIDYSTSNVEHIKLKDFLLLESLN